MLIVAPPKSEIVPYREPSVMSPARADAPLAGLTAAAVSTAEELSVSSPLDHSEIAPPPGLAVVPLVSMVPFTRMLPRSEDNSKLLARTLPETSKALSLRSRMDTAPRKPSAPRLREETSNEPPL